MWDRWVIGVHGIFYVLLLFCSVRALGIAEATTEQALIVGAGVLLALWYGLFIWRGIAYWEARPLSLALVFAIGWGVWVIVYRDFSIYGMMAFALFPLLFFYMLPPWSVVGSILLAFLTLTVGEGGEISSSLLLPGFLLMAVLFSLYMNSVADQSLERKQLIRELTQTRADLADAQRRAGILQERQRLSREIHDTLAQGFISVVMHLESAVSALPSDQKRAQTHILQATRTARVSLDESRRFVRELRPEALENGGLLDVLPEIVEKWADGAEVRGHFEIVGTPHQLPETAQKMILRIVQEALHNIRKHAEADNAFITLTFTPDALLVDIVDDGVGFRVGKSASGRYGLIGMRERAAAINARLTVDSTPGTGTTINLEIPLAR